MIKNMKMPTMLQCVQLLKSSELIVIINRGYILVDKNIKVGTRLLSST